MDDNILLVHQIPEKIIEILRNSKEYCFLITPYFQSWPILERELEKAAQDNKKIVFVFRDDYGARENFSYLNTEYDFDLIFVERLHTKLYMNEREALITSMNLYDTSKENNYEIGYFFHNYSITKDFKSKIVDNDILKANPIIFKGRYFKTDQYTETFSPFDFRENQYQRKKSNVQKNGICIRCGKQIRYNEKQPLCMDCHNIWATFQNINYVENFCHKCGQKPWENVTFANPICSNCRNKW